MESIEIAKIAVEAASNKQAIDVVLLDARHVCSFTDYFVICSGNNDRQIEAICDAVISALSPSKPVCSRVEGSASSGWILLDFGDIIVHVFTPDERDRYQLEDLWNRAQLVLRMQ
ncbi:MAG: ribosome silencing factor [Chloroflexota bacterium]|nr:ribosome silencing factor [Chloroflexota bacterium]